MARRMYRIWPAHARLDEEGAKRVGGRWNSPGKPVIFMAESVALAMRILTEEDFAAGFAGLTNRQLGDQWFAGSAVVPFEHNYLLNPQHSEFLQILVEPTVPFSFDERLFGSR